MVTSKAILDCDYYKTLIKAHLKVTSLLQAIVKLAVIDSLNLTRKRTINNYYPVLVDKSTVSVIKPREKRTRYNLHSNVKLSNSVDSTGAINLWCCAQREKTDSFR